MKAQIAISMLFLFISIAGADVSRQITVWNDIGGPITDTLTTEDVSELGGSYLKTWELGPDDPLEQPTLLEIDLLEVNIADLVFEW